jgi:hypothetical protein
VVDLIVAHELVGEQTVEVSLRGDGKHGLLAHGELHWRAPHPGGPKGMVENPVAAPNQMDSVRDCHDGWFVAVWRHTR